MTRTGRLVRHGELLTRTTPDVPRETCTLPAKGSVPSAKAGPGELLVQCWCQRRSIPVPKPEVMAGRTASCGRPSCAP